MTHPEVLQRVRKEFAEQVDTKDGLEKAFKDEITYDKIQDLEFMGYCFKETLRISPVSVVASPH